MRASGPQLWYWLNTFCERLSPNAFFLGTLFLGQKLHGAEAATVSQAWRKGLKGAAERFRPGRNVPNGRFETL